jgi:cobalamin synthase
LVSPVTVIGELAPVAVVPPQSAVWFTSVPLPNEPGVKATLALASNAVAVPIVGADGGVATGAAGVTAFELADHALVPTLLVVLTRQV